MTDLPSIRTIAPHLREPIFRTYEPFLTEAVAKWPTETGFAVPRTVAPATFLANFRNAIVSLVNYNWPTTVDRPKLLRIREAREYIVRFGNDGAVWFQSPKSEIRKIESTTMSRLPATASLPNAAQPSAPQSLVPWGDSTIEEISALCLLLDKQRIIGPYLITGNIGDGTASQLMLQYNVGIVYDEAKNLTTII
jgi:hypothetical protein